jgi:hypothetical protein
MVFKATQYPAAVDHASVLTAVSLNRCDHFLSSTPNRSAIATSLC